MASIIAKKIRGKTYYYARECQWIEGRPKITRQKYLGKADDIIARLLGPSGLEGVSGPSPVQAEVQELGASAALLDLARRLRLVEIIDEHVPKRGRGPSVGTYLLIAVLNRCIAPRSKAATGKWFEGTVLRRHLSVEAKQLSSQRFWDNMSRVSSKAIQAIEQDLTAHLVEEFDLDLSRLLFDATNFFTFIDTFNEKATLAQRGKSKEGRASLRIVGLALLVSADGQVPLFHRTYPGNQHDSPTFQSLTSELVERYRAICGGAEHVTIVFDKGNNSAENLEAIEGSPFHFVGSLVPTQHKDLLKVPAKKFHSLEEDGLPTVTAYRTKKKVFGVERTIVVAYNENLFVSQCQTLLREIGKRQRNLQELQTKLRRRGEGKVRGGNPPTLAATRKKVQSWLKARHMKDLFEAEVSEDAGLPKLTYRFKKRAWERLQKTLLGKTILFTDNAEWSDVEIVRGYRSQHHVEAAFRTLKDPHHIAIRPQFHWTDQKIEVHVFCCVLALTLCSLLRRELAKKGIEISVNEAMEELRAIQEVGILFPPEAGKKHPRLERTLSVMSARQQSLYGALDLRRYRAA
jgi:transposase